MKLTGSKILLECLQREGVEQVFGYPGGTVINIYDDLMDSPIKHILTRHEQAAVHAADGYARATGKVGVAIATSGPGATNTITGIARRHLRSDRLTEGLLNRVEHGIRLYDPCLSCATHLHGRLGMKIELLSPDGKVLDNSML